MSSSVAISPNYFNPPVAKSADGKLWFQSREGVQVVDPRQLPVNTIPPPVHIEQVTADRKTYDATSGLRLPPLIRDVSMQFTALSLVAPEKVRFRYRLEGHDDEWQEAGDRRQAFYMNLAPGSYRFRVMASNNSGVWNEEGALLDFSIAPAFYQTNWFRLAVAVLLLALLWTGFQLHTRRLRREEKRLRDVIEGIPAMAFSVHPDGSPDLINQRWLNYIGFSGSPTADGPDWEAAIHPDRCGETPQQMACGSRQWRAVRERGAPPQRERRVPLVSRAGCAAARQAGQDR